MLQRGGFQFHFGLGSTSSDQKRITLPLVADRSQFAVSRNDDGFVRQGENRIVERAHDLLHGAAGKIRTSNRSGKQFVTGYQRLLSLEIDTNAAFCVTGSV